MAKLYKTRGLVLNFIKYRESSIITRIFTEEFGVKSYIVNGVRSKKSKNNKIAFYQPLTFLDLVIYNKEESNLNRISEVHIHKPFNSLNLDFKKVSITIFLAEFLSKAIKEEGANPELFDFLVNSLFQFDQLQQNFENFHIQFIFKLSTQLGFAIHSAKELSNTIEKEIEIDPEIIEHIHKLINNSYEQFLPLNGTIRWHILQLLISFYQFHIENFGEIKSLSIIKDVFS